MGGVSSSPLLPCQHLRSCVESVLFPDGMEGLYPSVAASSGTEGTSLPGPHLRLGFSPDSSVHGMAVLRAGSCLEPPHRRGSPPEQTPPLQVSVVAGRRDGGGMGKTCRTPERGCPEEPSTRGVWVSCAEARLGFAFPLAPIQRSAAVG